MTGRIRATMVGVAAVMVMTAVGPAFAVQKDKDERQIDVLTGTREAAAFIVEVESRCSEFTIRSPEVVLRWRVDPAAAPKAVRVDELAAARDFKVDVTPFPRGLESGEFTRLSVSRESVADPTARIDLPEDRLPPTAGRELLIGDLQPGVTYRTRVLALTAQGWVASEEVMFRAAICPVDLGADDVPGGGL